MSSFAHGVAMVCCILLVYYGVNKLVFDIDKATGVPIAAKMDDVFKFITSSKPEPNPGMSVQDTAMGIVPVPQASTSFMPVAQLNTQSATQTTLQSNTPMQALVSAPMSAPNVKYIRLQKFNTTGDYPNSGASPSFQLSEIKVYSNNNLLTKSDFSSADFSPSEPGDLTTTFPGWNALDGNENNFAHSADANAPSLLLTLSSSKMVNKVIVFNRKGCCYERLNGVLLSLFDSNMNLINSCKLTANASTTCEW